jgi:hypothetical protein
MSKSAAVNGLQAKAALLKASTSQSLTFPAIMPAMKRVPGHDPGNGLHRDLGEQTVRALARQTMSVRWLSMTTALFWVWQ